MSQIYKTNTGGGGGGSINTLTPDSGGVISPTANNINIFGQTATDSNFVTTNVGSSTMTVTHKYQGAATTSDGAGQTQTILTIPVTVATSMTIRAMVAGIEATPLGVTGEISGGVFRGAGGATPITTANKFIDVSDPSISGCDLNVTTSGNNLIVTVTGKATFTIEWYCIAEIVSKSFI